MKSSEELINGLTIWRSTECNDQFMICSQETTEAFDMFPPDYVNQVELSELEEFGKENELPFVGLLLELKTHVDEIISLPEL